jgi:DNA processing protein
MGEDGIYWLAFSVFPGIGPVRFSLLLRYFGTAKAAWCASRHELELTHLGTSLVDSFEDFRTKFSLDTYQKSLVAKHISFIIKNDPRYPRLLAQIPDAPFVLYVKGKRGSQPLRLDRTIGVVGTRKITPYGKEVTKHLVEGLVSYGFTIVSGMAYGVDAVAHAAALEAGGQTIAVLGCGVDVIAPPSNTNLYNEICKSGRGAIVSEIPLGLRPNKGLFPARNRIISGLSLGVLVTEGAEDSGALITARNAGEQGREVFAVPGPITSSYSFGPAKLLKNGATLVSRVEDILDELNIPYLSTGHGPTTQKIPQSQTKEEDRILKLLFDHPMELDEIVRESGLPTHVVSSTLTVLELREVIKDTGEKLYALIK